MEFADTGTAVSSRLLSIRDSEKEKKAKNYLRRPLLVQKLVLVSKQNVFCNFVITKLNILTPSWPVVNIPCLIYWQLLVGITALIRVTVLHPMGNITGESFLAGQCVVIGTRVEF